MSGRVTSRVLVFGKTPALMPAALAALAAAGLEAEGVFAAGDAVARLRAGGIDAVAIGGGVGPGERAAVHAGSAGTPVVDVYGPGNLVDEVRRALAG